MGLHIGVDAWNLLGDRRGIGRYTRAILRRWVAMDPARIRTMLLIPEWPAFLHASRYQRESGAPRAAVAHRKAAGKLPLNAVWYPWNGMSWATTQPAIATLHDASLFAIPPADADVRMREQRPFRAAALLAKHFITNSQFSKTELTKHLGIAPDRIDVVHLGVDAGIAGAEPARFDGVPRYVLFVGEVEARKGLDTLLEALERIVFSCSNGPLGPLALVIAGRFDAATAMIPSSVRVIALGHVDDDRLAALYAGAEALVYPSRYEGFGLPVLEAMAAGAPVIASDAGGIPEAGGDAALYFNAGDAASLAAALQRLLSDEHLAADLRARGRTRAAHMTWDNTAEQTLAVFERVLPR